MAKTIRIQLTAREAGIMHHRLTCGDTIADCLIDDGDFPEHARHTIEQVANALACRCEQIMHHRKSGKGSLTTSGLNLPIARAVLQDAIEGSTIVDWNLDMLNDDEITLKEHQVIMRAAKSCAKKLRNAGIANDGFPGA